MKKQTLYRKLILLVIFIIFSSCNNEIKDTLKFAEDNMMESPEVVLDTLEKMDTSKIKTDKEKALFALLLTQARDKNYMFEKNDSLISIAVDYYDSLLIKDDKKRMLAHFYKGNINFNAREYPKALSEFIIALSFTEDKDYFYRGKIHDMIAELYMSSYNLTTAVKHRKLAVNNYNETDKKLYAFYAVDDLARNLLNIDSIEQAKNIIDSLYAIDDPELIPHRPIVNISNMYYYLNKRKFKEALKLFCDSTLYKHTRFILPQASPIAYMFACNNMPDSANEYLEMEERVNPNFLRNSWYNKAKYELARQTGDYKRMYETYVTMDSLGNINLKEALDRNVALQEAEFYLSEKQLAEKSRKTWIYISVITFSGVIILLLLLLLYRKQAKLNNIAMEQKLREFVSSSELNMARERETWTEREREFSAREIRMKDELEALTQQEKSIPKKLEEEAENRKVLLSEVLQNQLTPINRIANLYFKQKTTDERRKQLKKELSKIIAKMNTDEHAAMIQRVMDSVNDGIIKELTQEVPNLDKRDIKFATYELAGCTTNMIALLLDISTGHCRQIRRRLIQKIEKSGSDRAIEIRDQIFKDEESDE